MYRSVPGLEAETATQGGRAMAMTEKAHRWTEQGEEDPAFTPNLLATSVILGKGQVTSLGFNFLFCTMEVIPPSSLGGCRT